MLKLDSLAVAVVDNVDAVDQLKPKILVASVVFSMAEYILLVCSLWNLVTGVVIKPVVKIFKIAALLIVLLSVLSSSVVHDVASSLGVTSLLPYHHSYTKKSVSLQYLFIHSSFMMASSFGCQLFKMGEFIFGMDFYDVIRLGGGHDSAFFQICVFCLTTADY